MQIAHREGGIPVEQFKQMKGLRIEIRGLEASIEAEEKEINNLKQAREILNDEIKVTCFFVVVSLILFVRICARIFVFLYEFFQDIRLTLSSNILVFIVSVVFIAYTVKRVKKYFPMYIHCRQEEKGASDDLTNYVYQIKKHEHRKADYIKELEVKRQELNNLAEK